MKEIPESQTPILITREAVKKKTYALTNAYIVGYGTPAYPTDTKTE